MCSAPKTGSYALWYYLLQHPDILMSKDKEPAFFNLEAPNDLEERQYLRNFEHYTGEKTIGTGNLYLCGHGLAKRIHARIPNARLLFCYRNPLIRALSHY